MRKEFERRASSIAPQLNSPLQNIYVEYMCLNLGVGTNSLYINQFLVFVTCIVIRDSSCDRLPYYSVFAF